MSLSGAPNSYTDEELLTAWLTSLTYTDGAAPSWAFEALGYELVSEQPERAWLLIMELAERARTPDILAILAAGPLEDLLCQHGPAFIARVESRSEVSAQFRRCLSGVWGHRRMDPEIYRRMRVAVGDSSL